MFLPDDILSLIYSYAYYPLPAHWVNMELIYTDPYLSIASNGAGLPWIKKNFEIVQKHYKTVGNTRIGGIFRDIVSVESPNLPILFPIDQILQELENTPNLMVAVDNPYLYAHIPDKYKIFSYRFLATSNLTLNEQKSKIYSFLKFTNFMNTHGNNFYKYLARHPQYWDIFDEIINDKRKIEYYDEIAQNPCEQSCKFIESKYNKFLEDHPIFMKNPGAFNIIKHLIDTNKINLETQNITYLSLNPNPKVINLLKSHLDLVREMICANSLDEAVDIILANPKFINYQFLSSNTNPRIIPLLKANYSKLNYNFLGRNPLIFPNRFFTRKVTSKTRKYLLDEQINIVQEAKAKIEQANELINKLNIGYFN